MLSAYFNKFLIISASTVSAIGLLISVPQAVIAQEMTEDMNETMEVTEPSEMDSMEMDSTEMDSMEMDTQMGQTVDMDSEDMDSDGMMMENDSMMMESDDVDSDFDNDDDMDMESTPSYSNSPRALW